ncbi:hypothetical protein CDV31_007216 [Fusarium ambrosium]|uniref:Uncharacterized protein n=1 Tax=Fusarium ambrosium TaxID=131363 RepID=A0A428U7U0_9HYPO|nr:hypothetical protein CDV31_007216 [Fusarium ambrosium]
MKFSLPVIAALAPAACAQLIQVEVRYSDHQVDVGNLDLFKETWEKIYAADGNGRSVVSDTFYDTFADGCTHYTKDGNRRVNVRINGQWGRIPDVGLNDAREALVKSLWEVLKETSNPNSWDVFTNCYGTTWQEGVPRWEGPHACGGKDATVRSECLCDIGSAQCEHHSWAHKVPSMIKANLYRDGVLLADSLEIEFASTNKEEDGGCGAVGTIVSTLAGFLPGPGALFATGVDVFCGL